MTTTLVKTTEAVDLLAATALGLAFVGRDAADVAVLTAMTEHESDFLAARWRVLDMDVGDRATRRAAAALLSMAARGGALRRPRLAPHH